MPPMDKKFLSEIRSAAQTRIKNSLLNAREEANEGLRELAHAIAAKTDCKVWGGPIKSEDSANRKLRDDYSKGVVPEGDWLEMKDLVRLTLVGRDSLHVQFIVIQVRKYCRVGLNERQDWKGLGLMKDAAQVSDKNPSGYSGHNFVVRLRNGVPGEIQVNVPEILYGKGPKEDFCKGLGQREWDRIRSQYRIESSLGHGLYEVYRVAKASDNGKEATKLSKEYYGYLRGAPRFDVARALQEKLTAFKEKNKHTKDEKGKDVFHWDELSPWPSPTRRSGSSSQTRSVNSAR